MSQKKKEKDLSLYNGAKKERMKKKDVKER